MAFPAKLANVKPPLPPLRLALRGDTILTRPRFNKGTAFPLAERQSFGLVGRLPQKVNSLDEQCDRAYEQLQARDTPIRKNSFLQSLKDQNWTLYYALISRHLKELVPVIYTPTQAEAIMRYSHLFRRSEGLYLTFTDQDTMERDFLEQTQGRDASSPLPSTVVLTYLSLIGGLDPAKSVSVVLDVGTNNGKLLDDPLYVGEAYDQFVYPARPQAPPTLAPPLEDFGVSNAYRLLERYRSDHAVFNDDIQGTGAVTLSCIMSALGVSPLTSSSKPNKLSDQRYIIYGAGSAGLGIANQLRDAMVSADSISRESNSKFYLIDRYGGLRGEYWRPRSESWDSSKKGLLDVVEKAKPTDAIKAMKGGLGGKLRPIIMPLSNPSRFVGCDGMDVKGKEIDFKIAECNNALIYPGLGLGHPLSITSNHRHDAYRWRTAPRRTITRHPRDGDSANYEGASLLPDFADAPRVNFEIGVAVAEQAVELGVDEVREKAGEKVWVPVYRDYVFDKEGFQ
ncbi:hypothetical protein BDQ17DRAFT_1371957 [Cyathus striatus]|nr:hypothetical protein BDQ17DRAFT_1371957 [Cyathus striatus]